MPSGGVYFPRTGSSMLRFDAVHGNMLTTSFSIHRHAAPPRKSRPKQIQPMPLLRRYPFLLLAVVLSWFSATAQAVVPQIVAGYFHNAALKNDGTVWTWGYHGFGQLGVGTKVESTTPLRVKGLSGVRALAAGFFHTVALKDDGTVC